RRQTLTVQRSGAVAGSILHGVAPNNIGLRLKVCEDQPKGSDGGLKGKFTILEVGDHSNSGLLEAFLGQVTDADEVLRTIRRGRPGCISVVNTNVLALQATPEP